MVRGGSGWPCFAVLVGAWLPQPLDVVASELFGSFFSSWLHKAGPRRDLCPRVGDGDALPVGTGAALLFHLAGLLQGSADGNRIWGLHEA